MKDFTSGHISTEEATELIQYLDGCFDDVEIKLYPGISYRHLALLTAEEPLLSHLAALDCTPPHDITGKEYPPHLPAGECCQSVVSMMERSAELLSDHPVNKARIASGKQPATSMWLWGQGKTPSMQTFEELYGIKGAVISAVDLVNGIGVTAGLKVVRVEGATGYLDTNYEGKVAAALAALDEVDFVYLHVEAPDEAAHEGKVDLKIQAIEDFDSRIVAPCLDYLDTHPDCRILVAPDHVTSIESMTHAGGPIPFALCGAGVEADACTSYNEVAAAEQGVLFPIGHKLLPYMLNTESISSRTLP